MTETQSFIKSFLYYHQENIIPNFHRMFSEYTLREQKVGDNIILSLYRRKGDLHWTLNMKKASKREDGLPQPVCAMVSQ